MKPLRIKSRRPPAPKFLHVATGLAAGEAEILAAEAAYRQSEAARRQAARTNHASASSLALQFYRELRLAALDQPNPTGALLRALAALDESDRREYRSVVREAKQAIP